MIVDDRLETVLRTVAAGPGAIRTQFRQLADLLGRTPAERWSDAHAAALSQITAHHAALGDAASAALLRTCTLRSPILVEHFAHLGPRSALAAISGARLRAEEWLQLIPDLPVQARGCLRHRRDLGPAVDALLARLGITDFVLPLPAGYEPLVAQAGAGAPGARPADTPAAEIIPLAQPPAKPAAGAPQAEGIGAIVRRIEAFRRTREAQGPRPLPLADIAASGVQTRLPFEDEPPLQPREVTALDLRLDAQGTVISADAAHAHLLVGLRPFAADPDSAATCDALSLRAVRARLPVEAGRLAIDSGSALAGSWRVDAVPLFAPAGGHFLGYYARLRRPSAACAAPVAAANDDAPAGSDMLRQMLHELRTPINAIQGFAELIQQQLLGPTPHQYRSLAAGIASDAAHLLAGFEDIERLVALETGRLDSAAGEADLNALLERLLGQLDPLLTPREIKLRSELPGAPLPVALSPDELERTLWRLLLLIAGAAAPGERLTLSLKLSPGANPSRALLALPLPAALAMHDDEALMAPDVTAQAVSGGAAMLGGGFALRLAAAEIRAAGGTFARIGARLDIAFPLLTTTHQTLSHQDRPVGQAG